MNKINIISIISSVACIIACVGDFLVIFILSLFYKNYSHLKHTISELGTTQSPVSSLINTWWIIYGILIIIFAIGFWKIFYSLNSITVTVISILIITLGIGAGILAGIFSADPSGQEITLSGKIHSISAGIGFLAIIFMPLISLSIFTKEKYPYIFLFSIIIQILGMIFLIIIFISGKAYFKDSILGYSGLWQRLFLLNYYIYLVVIALKMFRYAT